MLPYSARQREWVPVFYRAIDKHALIAVSFGFRIADMRRAMDRLHIPEKAIDYGKLAEPYVMAFIGLTDIWASQRHIMPEVSIGERLNFFFDEHSHKKKILKAWDIATELRPDITASMRTPRFEDDDEFLPLQAADFWPWWIREWN